MSFPICILSNHPEMLCQAANKENTDVTHPRTSGQLLENSAPVGFTFSLEEFFTCKFNFFPSVRMIFPFSRHRAMNLEKSEANFERTLILVRPGFRKSENEGKDASRMAPMNTCQESVDQFHPDFHSCSILSMLPLFQNRNDSLSKNPVTPLQSGSGWNH